jgi:GR25 family glycosyltransferase involved in LPS biosynthesis
MEDDARLSPDFRSVVEAILVSYASDSVPRVFLLETRWAYCIVAKSKGKRIPGFDGANVITPRTATIGAAAYLINRRAAALYVETSRPVEFVADWHPAFWGGVDVSVVHPQPALLASVESTLEAGRAEADPLKIKFGRLMSTYTGIRYIRHRAIYRNPGTYFRHEIARPWWYFLGRRFGRRISAHPDAPLSVSFRPKRKSP